MADQAPLAGWSQHSRYCQVHHSGARVAACKGAAGWRYLAYGPDRAVGWSYRAWNNGSIPHWSGQEPAIRYALGDAIPQRRALLGSFETAAEARACCEAAAHSPDHLADAGNMVSPQEQRP
ncbi:MAG: hypothetical protein ACLFS2_11325 [Halochromatium sp.]|uniref:hypothetical protein n=1 Tax=Halochromatium sp. TaxID=2049430 RepID=UPI003979E9A8